MILLIDNYDSFTYNLYQQISSLGKEVKVVRNDAITIDNIKELDLEAIVLSPGPGTPQEAGITVEVVKEFYNKVPILGICLGHQAIGEAFGAKITQARQIMHGKISYLQYDKKGIFAELDGEIEVMRYHSLVIEPKTLSDEFQILATTKDDVEIMAIQHKQYPVVGLQFHPESIGTLKGTSMVSSFFENVKAAI